MILLQTILMKYHTLFFSKIEKEIEKDVAKFDICCSRDWLFKGLTSLFVCDRARSSDGGYYVSGECY